MFRYFRRETETYLLLYTCAKWNFLSRLNKHTQLTTKVAYLSCVSKFTFLFMLNYKMCRRQIYNAVTSGHKKKNSILVGEILFTEI